jgi:dTDP-4-dehydrorhamnose 3,5-epimerase
MMIAYRVVGGPLSGPPKAREFFRSKYTSPASMVFQETPLSGAYVIDIEPRVDQRGFFARAFCRKEFEEHELETNIVQGNISFNESAGTLRGMHYQRSPHAEVKLVRCTRGSIFDVIVDLRLNSPTYRKWFGDILSAENRRMMYVPKGFAHGYQTLDDQSEVLYMVTETYAPSCESGVRWDDPAIGIEWPLPEPIVSERDRQHPLLNL